MSIELHPPHGGTPVLPALSPQEAIVTTTNVRRPALANAVLNAAASFWYLVTIVGQGIFVIYIAGFYGRAAWNGKVEEWGKVMPHGYVAGDPMGNAVVGIHLLFAALIMLSGTLQLLPILRRVAPAVHRWNGRFYVLSAMLMSVGGLVMVWTRGTVGGPVQHMAISVNAVLIMAFAGLALWHAMAGRIDVHRRWALRLFLAVSGVWFFRVGLMAWILIHQGPVGFDPESFRGPFLDFLAFAQYLLPLAVLELYFRTQHSRRAGVRHAMAALLTILGVLTAAGIAGATMGMWLPRL